jgi:hypothetical protein
VYVKVFKWACQHITCPDAHPQGHLATSIDGTQNM